MLQNHYFDSHILHCIHQIKADQYLQFKKIKKRTLHVLTIQQRAGAVSCIEKVAAANGDRNNGIEQWNSFQFCSILHSIPSLHVLSVSATCNPMQCLQEAVCLEALNEREQKMDAWLHELHPNFWSEFQCSRIVGSKVSHDISGIIASSLLHENTN